MTATAKKQLALLGVLVGVFVVVWFVRPSGQAGTASAPSNQTGGRGEPVRTPQVADVNLEALQAPHAAPAAPARNLFTFRQRAVAASPAERQGRPRSIDVQPSVPQGPPPPPPIPLKYIGVVEQGGASGGKVAIFSDGRGSTFYGREGDVIDGRYKVIRIGTESIEVSYIDGRGRQTLRLSGQ